MSSLIVEPLSRDRIRAVYPLIREAIPGLGLNEWLRFARIVTEARRDPRAGVMVARRESHDYPIGLFCYRVERDVANTRVLVAENFIAVDLLHPDEVLHALVAELEALGARLGCKEVRSIVRKPELAGELAQAGHAAMGAILGKVLAERGISTVAGSAAGLPNTSA